MQYWHIKRARIGKTCEVRASVILNGYSVPKQNLLADRILRDLNFGVKRSNWLEVRILGSSPANPFLVIIDGKPVRPSWRSTESCLKGVH